MLSKSILPPIVLQIVGLTAFVFFCAFWAVTGRVEPLLLAGSGTLYGAGLVNRGVEALNPDKTVATSGDEEVHL